MEKKWVAPQPRMKTAKAQKTQPNSMSARFDTKAASASGIEK
jgi:hypothetical protein